MSLALAVAAAHDRHQRVLQDIHGGSITLAGVVYRAAVHLGNVRHEMDESGTYRQVQEITVSIFKTSLRAAPAKQTTLVHGGVSFQVDHVYGHNEIDRAWRIIAKRKLPSPS